MKIAVSSQNKKEVTGHAGKCLKWWIFEIQDNEIINKNYLELEKEQSFHNSPGNLVHPLDGIDILISLGMGDGMKRRLESKGTKAVITAEKNIDTVISEIIN